jgi:hypothetical protein
MWKRSRCGGKRSKRKGYTKKHYTRKNKKYIKNQKRLRRQTRKKVGGLFSSRPKILPSLSERTFNFVLPETITDKNNINIQGAGWAYVTRLNSRTSMSDRPEQIIIYKKLDNAGQLTGSYFIARCPHTECDITDRDNMREKNMKPLLETDIFSFEVDKHGVVYTFITTDGIHYRINPRGSSLQIFFTDENQEGNPSENVKIKSTFGYTDANALIFSTSKTTDRDYPEDIYTLYIDGKEQLKFLLKRDSGFEYHDANDKTIDGTCCRLYKFTDMVDKSKSIEIYVPVSRTIGSIFHTLQPQLAGNEDIDIFDLCGYD